MAGTSGRTEQHETQPGLAQRRHVGDAQRDARLQRVGRSEGRSDDRRADAHREAGDGPEAEAAARDEDDGDQRRDLLVEIHERAQRGERQADAHHDQPGPVGAPHDDADQPCQCAGGVEQGDGTAASRIVRMMSAPGHNAARCGRDRADQAHWRRRHAHVTAGDDHRASGGGIGPSFVLARRNHPGEGHAEGDPGQQEHERVTDSGAVHRMLEVIGPRRGRPPCPAAPVGPRGDLRPHRMPGPSIVLR